MNVIGTLCHTHTRAPQVAIDEGNASPRFMRLTCNHIPSTPELVDASRIAVGAVIQPLANLGRDEEPVPVVDFGASGPLRSDAAIAKRQPHRIIESSCILNTHEKP